MNLAKSINVATARAEMTQKELAMKMGKHPNIISQWKAANDAKVSDITAMAEATGFEVGEFLALGD